MSKKIQKIIYSSVCFAFCFASVLCLLPSEAKAASASLYLSPPSGTYTVDSIFSVKVKVNSVGEFVNAAEGTLIFNPDEVQVKSISKTGSIFNLWTTEPVFSNSVGNIIFAGGATSNFKGASGTVITISFKAKSASSAQINFSSGSVLMADGKGTNILGSMNGGAYTLKSKIITPPIEQILDEPPTHGNAPNAPNISSLTHPDADKWYSNNNPEFSWTLPANVTAVRLLISHLSIDIPNVFYGPSILEKKLKNLDDGIWYFHIQSRNKFGWGRISHFKFQIDTELPDVFEIIVDNQGDFTNPSPILYFETKDLLSGVEYYEINICGKESEKIFADKIKDNLYRTPLLIPGKHNIIVKAFDKASNFAITAIELTIEPIGAPIITDFLETIDTGDSLIIKGTSLYSESEITVFTKKQGEEAIANNTKTDNEGNWVYIHPKTLERGIYQIQAQITDERGAKSNLTEKITIIVESSAFLKFSETVIDFLSIVIVLISLIVVLIAIIFYGWKMVFKKRKEITKETKEAKKTVKESFSVLLEKIEEQIQYLDGKKGLTKTERQVQKNLKKALDVSKKAINKEIQDIRTLLK